MWHWRLEKKTSPLFWYLRPTCTYTTMATTIAETVKKTQAYSAKANKDKLCETKQNQRYSPVKKNNTTSASEFEPFPLLEFLSITGKLLRYLHGSYLLPDHNPYFLMFCFFDIFLFFICHFSLSVVDLLISVLYTQIERSLLSISTRHAPLLLVGYKCVLGLGQALRQKKRFSKIASCTFKGAAVRAATRGNPDWSSVYRCRLS